MKNIKPIILALLIVFIIAGCGEQAEGKANEAENISQVTGTQLNHEGADNHENKAVQIVEEQKRLYQEALTEMENQNPRKAFVIAQEAAELIEGTKEMNRKAIELMEEIQADIDRQQAEDKDRKETDVVKVSSTETFTYADFKGIYAMYEGEPYHSEIVVTTILSDDYLTDIVTDWMEYTAAKIESVVIEGNRLNIAYEGKEDVPLAYAAGSFTGKLQYEGNGDKVLIINGYKFYSLTREQFNTFGYSLDEALFKGL